MVRATPAEMASWPAPNYVNPTTRTVPMNGTLIAFTVLMLVFVGMRFFARGRRKDGLGLDDWIMGFAAAFALALTIIGVVSTMYGGGHHIWDIKDGWAVKYTKLQIASDALFNNCVSFTKISICITYLRLFPTRSNKIFSYSMIIYQALWDIGVTILMILQCIPIEAFWDSTIEGARCLDFRSSLLSTAALNTLSDFLVFLWPAHALWNVQLPVKQRIQLIIIFSMGCIVCIGGICRMWYIEVYFSTYDSFWEGAIVWIIMSLEYTIGIICGCLPSVKPLLASLFPAIFGSSHPSHPSRSGAYGRSTHNGGRSWPLNSLTTHKSKDARNGHATVERVEEVDLSDAPTASVGYAWAISGRRGSAAHTNSEDGDRLVGVPKNGIKRDIVVETVVHDSAESREGLGMGLEESREPSMRKGGDASSEEWIMSDGK